MKIFLYFWKQCIHCYLVIWSRNSASDSFVTPWIVACLAPPSMGFFQARIVEWVAISFFRASSGPMDRTHITCIASGFFTTEPQGKCNVFIASRHFRPLRKKQADLTAVSWFLTTLTVAPRFFLTNMEKSAGLMCRSTTKKKLTL